MKRPVILLALLTVCFAGRLSAQNCPTLGQSPNTAFPVCGTKEFKQNDVPLCEGKKVPTPCDQPEITDKNPFWYKFTCYTTGTLGFLITPNNLEDDYDWQLFDITGSMPQSVYSNKDLFVACNWSAHPGTTGTAVNATSLVSCINNTPVYSAMPTIIQGHEYLLLVSHFTESQSGYALSFSGGTADITDPKVPQMSAATGSCKGTEAYVKLNKAMKCSSLSADGSEFTLDGAPAGITGAYSPGCSTGFSTDSIIVRFSQALPMGDYTLQLKTGGDGNILLDDCDNEMPASAAPFRVYEDVSADFTYITKTGCERDTIEFAHDGAHGVHTWNWTFDEITSLNQSAQVVYQSAGNKYVQLVVSNDHCLDTAEQSIALADKISAAVLVPEVTCSVDPVSMQDLSTGQITSWQWNFGEGSTSTEKNPPAFRYPHNTGEKTYRVSLVIGDAGGCIDSAAAQIIVVGNCNIVIPSAFTPNKDGRNDELYPTNAFNANNLLFRVYNRFGQIVFETRDWKKKWDGTLHGQPQPSGTYVWTLNYVLKTTGRPYSLKGTTVLIR